MPNFNIHWKGYPHHRLPRIRVVSTRRNLVQSRSFSTPGQASRTQSHLKNVKESKKRPLKIQFRRQRMRGSRASSSILRARRLASVRARHNIQVFGWDTPGAELASRVTKKTGSGNRTPNRRSISGANQRPEPKDDSAIPSTDGTASSVARRLSPAKRKSENVYSLRHITKVPVYWTADHPSTVDQAHYNPDRLYAAQGSGPLQAASNRISGHRPTEENHSYDIRIDPLSKIASQRRRLSTRPQFKANTFRKATSQISPTWKDPGSGSPEFWEAVRNYSQQSRLQGKSTASVEPVVQSFLSETASRSPSQRKALARFTKGIELYLQAARKHPSQSLVSSLSSSSLTGLSACTIQELKPYQSQFQSAGLAVTSTEQKGIAKLQKWPTPPSTPPKDDKYVQSRTSLMMSNNDNQKLAQEAKLPSYASGSTGTTVLGWTPPHEKTYGSPSAKEKRRASVSTDQTIIGFTPPHEMYASSPKPAREAPAPPRASTKKSLPWLRKAGISPEASPTKNLSDVSAMHERHRPSTPLGSWVSTFDVPEPTDTRKESQSVDKSRPEISQRPMQVNRADVKSSARKSTATNYMNQVVDEMARQSTLALIENPETGLPKMDYVHIGTQTLALSPPISRRDTIQDNQAEREVDIGRALVSSSRSKTFPLKSNNYKGDYVQPSAEPFSFAPQHKSSRLSKVTWKVVEQESQAATGKPQYQSDAESAVLQQQPSFQSNAVPGERTRTFPCATTPIRRIGPYQAPPQSRSAYKSMDESKTSSVQKDEESYQSQHVSSEPSSIAPSSRHSPLPLCTQCTGPLNPELGPEPITKPEPSIHACTARSSTQCQQCFPSRNSSIAVSPLQATLPAEVRAPIEVQYLPSRRSTRPIIPARPFDYPEDTSSPKEAEVVVDTSKLNYTAGKKRPQSLAELAFEEYTKQEPMADPMKRASLPRLKLRPVISETPKHVHCYSTVSRPKTIPQMPIMPTVETVPFPAVASITSADSSSVKSGRVSEKQVFKGLHVATVAACDEDVDKWIEEITGSSARKFLSTLSAFDGLGVNTLAGVARKAAKQRREKLEVWEAIREKRLAEQDQKPRCEVEDCVGMEYMLGDQDVRLASKCSQKQASGERDVGDMYMAYDQGIKQGREELGKSMLKRRDCKMSEGVRNEP
ncbi:hypothetical protein BKA64DRAFT_302755 [Cadophora sp. MPI-SDFR-AT-0126]|nr:hypothetical protein BKA64DRAFT_302755 [Leotiomycetes sp. MPI-SDFR-AT-0126]